LPGCCTGRLDAQDCNIAHKQCDLLENAEAPLAFLNRSLYNVVTYFGVTTMPTISMFYGLLIQMYFYDDKRHNCPHIHAEYADDTASIATGEVLAGKIPPPKLKLVQAWIEIHKEDLMANWKLAISGAEVFKIDPLK
jgi:hypothetical protein